MAGGKEWWELVWEMEVEFLEEDFEIVVWLGVDVLSVRKSFFRDFIRMGVQVFWVLSWRTHEPWAVWFLRWSSAS